MPFFKIPDFTTKVAELGLLTWLWVSTIWMRGSLRTSDWIFWSSASSIKNYNNKSTFLPVLAEMWMMGISPP